MNTANLQHEGLLLALSALLDMLEKKGLVERRDILDALAHAAAAVGDDPKRPEEVSAANVDAILFPIRFLTHAVESGQAARSFGDVATTVGQAKPDR